MPVYEYECAHCGVLEINQSINDDPLTKCPNCRRKIKKLISMNSFHLKGSGWYATDYAKKSGTAPSAPTPKTDSPKAEKPSACAGCEKAGKGDGKSATSKCAAAD